MKTEVHFRTEGIPVEVFENVTDVDLGPGVILIRANGQLVALLNATDVRAVYRRDADTSLVVP